METVGLQHVLTLSNVAEKVQHEAQNRIDLAHLNIAARDKDKELEESAANPPAEMTRHTLIHQDEREKKNLKDSAGSKKGVAKKDSKENSRDEQTLSSNEGNMVDLFV